MRQIAELILTPGRDLTSEEVLRLVVWFNLPAEHTPAGQPLGQREVMIRAGTNVLGSDPDAENAWDAFVVHDRMAGVVPEEQTEWHAVKQVSPLTGSIRTFVPRQGKAMPGYVRWCFGRFCVRWRKAHARQVQVPLGVNQPGPLMRPVADPARTAQGLLSDDEIDQAANDRLMDAQLAALNHLDEVTRAVIIATVMQDPPASLVEIADALGITDVNARVKKFRGLQRMRRELLLEIGG